MSTIACIHNGVVVNVIISSESMAAQLGFDATPIIDGLDPMPGIGWTYADSAFSEPTIVPVNYGTKLTKEAFINRFTSAEIMSVMSAAASSIPVTEVITWFNNVVQYIDLDDPNTAANIAILSGANLLTAARASAITTTPVAAGEQYHGG